jgi:hypothetical protein
MLGRSPAGHMREQGWKPERAILISIRALQLRKVENLRKEAIMKTKAYATILTVIPLMLFSAAGALTQTEHQRGAKKPTQHVMSKMDMSSMMNEPHHVLATADMQNIGTVAKTLHNQAEGSSPLNAKFPRAAVDEIKRSLERMDEHHGEHMKPPDRAFKRVRATVIELEASLQMPQRVGVSIVPADERIVSVLRIHGNTPSVDAFMISLDQAFYNSLSQEELRAVIAHELGHVWIFSHFPYLQTEILANEIAMRAVSRDSMKKIYAKLWLRLGTTGDLEAVLGSDKDEPKTPFQATASAAPRN